LISKLIDLDLEHPGLADQEVYAEQDGDEVWLVVGEYRVET
jgi:hypothetical protein